MRTTYQGQWSRSIDVIYCDHLMDEQAKICNKYKIVIFYSFSI